MRLLRRDITEEIYTVLHCEDWQKGHISSCTVYSTPPQHCICKCELFAFLSMFFAAYIRCKSFISRSRLSSFALVSLHSLRLTSTRLAQAGINSYITVLCVHFSYSRHSHGIAMASQSIQRELWAARVAILN